MWLFRREAKLILSLRLQNPAVAQGLDLAGLLILYNKLSLSIRKNQQHLNARCNTMPHAKSLNQLKTAI